MKEVRQVKRVPRYPHVPATVTFRKLLDFRESGGSRSLKTSTRVVTTTPALFAGPGVDNHFLNTRPFATRSPECGPTVRFVQLARAGPRDHQSETEKGKGVFGCTVCESSKLVGTTPLSHRSMLQPMKEKKKKTIVFSVPCLFLEENYNF